MNLYHYFLVTFYDCTKAQWREMQVAMDPDLDQILEAIYHELKNMNANNEFVEREGGEVKTAEEVTDELENSIRLHSDWGTTEIYSAEGLPSFMIQIEKLDCCKFYKVNQ